MRIGHKFAVVHDGVIFPRAFVIDLSDIIYNKAVDTICKFGAHL